MAAGGRRLTPALFPTLRMFFNRNLNAAEAEFAGEGEFFFVPFVSPTLAEAGANKPWLQELPDPTTTVMWNTWVEINPDTAQELGLEDDDVVKIVSEAGELEAARLPVSSHPPRYDRDSLWAGSHRLWSLCRRSRSQSHRFAWSAFQ